MGDDLLTSRVRVAARRIDEGRDDPAVPSIRLTSDGEPITALAHAIPPDRRGSCPPPIAEMFAALTA